MLFKMATSLSFYSMFKVAISGIMIGAANLIPGISGATLAILMQQYNRIIQESEKLMAFNFKQVSFVYLGTLIIFVFLGIKILSGPMHHVMVHYQNEALSLIAGSILGSISMVKVAKKPVSMARQCLHPLFFLGCLVGAFMAVFQGAGSAGLMQPSMGRLFFSGALAMMAMMVPGISGSLLLLLIGTYTPILLAIEAMDFTRLIPVSLGAIFGGAVSIKLIGWAIQHRPDSSQSAAMGLTVGSIFFILIQIGQEANLRHIFGIIAGLLLSLMLIRYAQR